MNDAANDSPQPLTSPAGPPPQGQPPAEPGQPAPGYAPPPAGPSQPAPGYAPPPAAGQPGAAPGYVQPIPGYPHGAPAFPPVQAWQPPRPYNHGLRRDQGGNLWRGIVAILMLGAAFLLFQVLLSVVIIIDSGSLTDLSLTPVGLLATNLGLAALWPTSLAIQRILYGPRPGTLHSVTGKIRWRLFFILAGVLVPAYVVYIAISHLLYPVETGPFTTTAVGFIVVAILTSPLQSAGEEVAFRGLLPRAIGGWFATHRMALVVGTLISAVLFAAAHGAGDWWLNAYYAVFGLCMAVMTWRTQGLEAAMIAHAANNTFLMVLNAVMGMDFDDMFDREAGAGGPFMLVGMGMCVLVTALVWWRTSRPKARAAMELPENITPNP